MTDPAILGRAHLGRFILGHYIMNTLDPSVGDSARVGGSRADVTKIAYPIMIKKIKGLIEG